ncbi:hypothetical protein Q5H91_06140 [Sphingomonas sp. KR1UV-12]|uniref:CopG family transcriptional regulator n=1 Tax=Sphingomonas aurea TaxID=3063994 RepID=A0ABT9EJG3_9SPHN|nr:hypothetical protein [Sphingomonas sp. KR1UV-12]MDP1026783.1 hypothetical protein [Sphingomonas sp. KR1UV-12]
MNAFASITAPLDAATLALVEERARERGITGAEFAAEAIREAVERDDVFAAAIRAEVDEADAQIERGEFYTQEQIEAWLEDRKHSRR